MEILNIESLPFIIINDIYPEVTKEEIRDKTTNLDLFLSYFFNMRGADLLSLVQEYDFSKNILEKPYNINTLITLPILRKFKIQFNQDNLTIFPPNADKVNSVHFLIYFNYYLNNFSNINEINKNEFKKVFAHFFEVLININPKILFTEDSNKFTVGDYLLMYPSDFIPNIFEKHDNEFKSLKKVSMAYIEQIFFKKNKNSFFIDSSLVLDNPLYDNELFKRKILAHMKADFISKSIDSDKPLKEDKITKF
jgi:hypothetical protein